MGMKNKQKEQEFKEKMFETLSNKIEEIYNWADEKHLIKELKAIRDILLPVKDALDDDGLEAYADELHGLLDRIDNLLISVSNQLTTRS